MTAGKVMFGVMSVVLLAVTTMAMATDGFVAIFMVATESWAGAQVFTDLCVALLVAGGWMMGDARRRGLVFWPWLLAIPALGSISLIGYMLWSRVLVQQPEVAAA